MSYTIKCQQCGQSFQPKNPKKKFCTRKCYLDFWKRQRETQKRICLGCGSQFVPSHAHAKFCSQDCFNEYQRSGRTAQVCPTCGRTFQNAPSRGYTFCSWACYRASLHQRPSPGVTKTCLSCGQTFTVSSKGQRFCSKKCHDQYQRSRRVEIVCLNCGKRMLVVPSLRRQKFCSRECYSEYRHKTSIVKSTLRPCLHCGRPLHRKQVKFCSRDCRHAYEQARLIAKTCEYCGREYRVVPSLADRARFCSRVCYDRYRATRPRGHHRRSSTTDVVVRCAFCGQEIQPTKYRLRQTKSGRLFCSLQCRDSYTRKYRVRVENTCACCGEADPMVLDRHHIDGDRGNNDLNNVLILCANCHRRFTLAMRDPENYGLVTSAARLLKQRQPLSEHVRVLLGLGFKEKGSS